MLKTMLKLCEDKGLKKPSCYQGDYNLITRGMETKLLPILRAHGMSYNAFRYFLTSKIKNSMFFCIVGILGLKLISIK